MQTQNIKEIKKIIMTELPGLLESDPDIRNFILSVTQKKYADKTETERRIDRVLDELKRDREARDEKWDAQEKKWEAWEKKWEAWEKKWEIQTKKQDEKWEVWEKNGKSKIGNKMKDGKKIRR